MLHNLNKVDERLVFFVNTPGVDKENSVLKAKTFLTGIHMISHYKI